MGCHILEDPENGACFYCSTTGIAFGPVMGNREEAEMFCQFVPCDPRSLTQREIMDKYSDFVHAYVCECGNLRDEFDCEMKANDLAGECKCGDDGGGDCDWCKSKQAAADPSIDEDRFVCYQCVRKEKKHVHLQAPKAEQ